MNKINAVILAGSGSKHFFRQGVANKALFEICGRPMVEYVVDALKASPGINKISIVGPVAPLKNILGDKIDYYYEDDNNSIFDNAQKGTEPFINDSHVLIVTSDIPLVTGPAITEFLSKCSGLNADLCYPIVGKKLNELMFPRAERTYVHLKDGVFTGGNMIYVNPAIIGPCGQWAQKIIEYRKKPWKTSRILGLKFLAMFMTGKLSISQIERRFSELLNIKAVAVLSSYPELANDVDKPSDVQIAESYFSRMDQQVSN
jgi:GTP:adenosylcobinamide-phosphate guanylyltransferase